MVDAQVSKTCEDNTSWRFDSSPRHKLPSYMAERPISLKDISLNGIQDAVEALFDPTSEIPIEERSEEIRQACKFAYEMGISSTSILSKLLNSLPTTQRVDVAVQLLNQNLTTSEELSDILSLEK